MTQIGQYGLPMVALIIYTGELGLPFFIPAELALLLAGSQLIHSPFALLGAAILFGLVDLVASCTTHLAARVGGNRLLVRLMRRFHRVVEKPQDKLQRWRGRLGGRDPLVIFVTRLIPILRFYASFTSGLLRLRLRDFLAGAAPAAILWTATPLTVGFLFRGDVAWLTRSYGAVLRGALLLGAVLALAAAARWRSSRQGRLHGSVGARP